MKIRLINLNLVIIIILGFTSCAAPVVVQHNFQGKDKTAKMFIKRAQEGDSNLFDSYIKICNLDEKNEEKKCKDTLLLQNVTPSSIF